MRELGRLKENAVHEQNYMKADEYNSQINEMRHLLQNAEEVLDKCGQIVKRTDVPTIEKYLNIVAALLTSPQVMSLSPILIRLKEDVNPFLIHPNVNVKSKALKCYILFCLIDKNCARDGIHICSVPVCLYVYIVRGFIYSETFLMQTTILYKIYSRRS